jgi:hypothetical protein
VDDREILITETWLLNREIGYLKFRSEFFTDAAAMNKWPDPAVRERELRDFWNEEANADYPKYRDDPAVRERELRDFWNEDASSHYPQFREDTANMSDERLIGYRDQLQGALASRRQQARLPSPGEIAGARYRDEPGGSDAGMSKKGLKALFAEWNEDYAARRAEDAERRLRSPGESAAERRGGPDEGRGR